MQAVALRDHRTQLAFDASVALGLFLLVVLGTLAYERAVPDAVLPGIELSVVLAAAVTLPLALRRRLPLSVLLMVTVAFVAFRLVNVPEVSISSLALFVALYTAGAEVPPERNRLPRMAVVLAMLVLLLYQLAGGAGGMGELEAVGADRLLIQVFSVVFNLCFFAAAWLIGDLVWQRRTAAAELAARADELAASREELARNAVQHERVRIARELHDVVAHHVSVIGIQAGAARRALDRDAQQVAPALASIEDTSREAIGELQGLLTVLRGEPEPADAPAPQPTLAQLDALLDQVRATGMQVHLEVRGSRRRLADTLELSAYRIVQEALTNALKHARDATCAEVTISYASDHLRLRVSDDGAAAARLDGASNPGSGLIGMRERATLHGGQMHAASRPGGGFVIDATLPLPTEATT